MYSYEDRMRAVKLYIKLGKPVAAELAQRCTHREGARPVRRIGHPRLRIAHAFAGGVADRRPGCACVSRTIATQQS